MPKCQRVFNFFGMKHLQALMLGFVYGLDNVNMIALGLIAKQKRTMPTGNIPQERIWETDYNLVLKYEFLPVGLGRLMIASLILRINNKYILLVFAIIEMLLLLIGHAVYIKQGFEALQYTYLVALLIQGARWPLAANIVSKWSTSTTFTLMLWTFKASIDVFMSIYYVIVDKLQHHGILSICIYLSVIVKGTFFVLWIIFGSGDPIQNIFISKEELFELRDEHRLRLKSHWKQRTPLRKILKTPMLYGCLIFNTAYMWYHTWDGNGFIHPFAKYRQTGHWHLLFGFYLQILATGVVAFCTDLVIKKKKATLNNIRKTTAAISAWGSGSCFLLLGAYLGKDNATTSFMVLNQIFQICSGYYDSIPITHAISPNYMGYTHCLISSVAYLSMGFRPLVDKSLGADAGTDPTKAMSFLLFYYGFFLYFGCLLMLLSGTCRRREYDTLHTVPWKEDSIVSFP